MRIIQIVGVVCLGLFSLGAGSAFAQHEFDPHDAEAGGQRFMNVCVSCHGPDGDQVPGIDLGHGKFVYATTDSQIVEIILHGIAGSGMPANKMTEAQAYTVVAYLHFLADSAAKNTSTGDPARGKAIFDGKGGCHSCHRVMGDGSRLGPDLSEIGRLRRSVDLQVSVLDPDAQVVPSNRFVRVVTSDGLNVTGRLLNHDTFGVELIDSQENLRSFNKAELREFTFLPHSLMPAFRDKLTAQEVSDVVTYLTTLKGAN
jgi:putative heme-binding domain-containing protein